VSSSAIGSFAVSIWNVFWFRKNVFIFISVKYAVQLGYNDFGLFDTSVITLNILWYELIPHKARGFFSTTYIRASASDITTVKGTQQVQNGKKKADLCGEFGLINSTIQTIWKKK
jgi:hypothetical protein